MRPVFACSHAADPGVVESVCKLDVIEQDAIFGLNHVVERGEVAVDRRAHRTGIALPARSAALDAGESDRGRPTEVYAIQDGAMRWLSSNG